MIMMFIPNGTFLDIIEVGTLGRGRQEILWEDRITKETRIAKPVQIFDEVRSDITGVEGSNVGDHITTGKESGQILNLRLAGGLLSEGKETSGKPSSHFRPLQSQIPLNFPQGPLLSTSRSRAHC